MPNTLRRKILGGLLLLPFSGKVIKASIANTAQGATNDIASPELALNAVRFFNTMEAWHKLKFDVHASYPQLLEWEVFQKTLTRLSDNQSTRAEGLRSRLNVEAGDLLPGWHFTLHTSPRNEDYLIVMRSHEKILASDGAAVIYHGDIAPEFDLPQSYAPLGTIIALGLEPLTVAGISRKVARERVSSVVRRVAFMSIGASPRETGCGCNCSGTAQASCWNSGFDSCPWCCCGYCDNCCLNAESGGCVSCDCRFGLLQ